VTQTVLPRAALQKTISTFLWLFFTTVITQAQVIPSADHHAHLQSPTAARLLNEGGRLHSDNASKEDASQEKEIPLTAKDLIHALDAAGVGRAAALSDAYLLGTDLVHVPDEVKIVDEENDWTLHQVEQYPERLVGFCSVNPIRPYALAAISHCIHIGLNRGLKLHLAASHFRFENVGEVHQLQQVFREANRQHMAILIHLHPYEKDWNGRRSAQIFLEQVLSQAPDVPVQVAHMAGWGGFDRNSEEALATFADACEHRNPACTHLYFDISAAIVPPLAPNATPPGELQFAYEMQKNFPEGPSHLAANMRRLGLNRILFATDWPVFTPKDYIEVLRAGLPLAPAEIDQIFRNVAPYFPAER
jgi:predicted TIM-barrel fold metal-dependent hydrolase